MIQWMNHLLEVFVAHSGYMGAYALIAGVIVISGLGVPIPEDIPLLFGGLLCGLGHTRLWVMIPLCVAAISAADLIVYGGGRLYGHHISKIPLIRRYLTEARLARAEQSFHRHGVKTLFVARFLPGLRSPIFFTAGTFKIPWWKFMLVDGCSIGISAPAFILAGYYGAQHFDKVVHYAKRIELGLAITLAIALVALLLWSWRRRRRAAKPVLDA